MLTTLTIIDDTYKNLGLIIQVCSPHHRHQFHSDTDRSMRLLFIIHFFCVNRFGIRTSSMTNPSMSPPLIASNNLSVIIIFQQMYILSTISHPPITNFTTSPMTVSQTSNVINSIIPFHSVALDNSICTFEYKQWSFISLVWFFRCFHDSRSYHTSPTSSARSLQTSYFSFNLVTYSRSLFACSGSTVVISTASTRPTAEWYKRPALHYIMITLGRLVNKCNSPSNVSQFLNGSILFSHLGHVH